MLENFVVWLNPNMLICGKVALMDDLLHRMWLVKNSKDGDDWRSQALEDSTFLLFFCYFAYVLLFLSYEHLYIIFHVAPMFISSVGDGT
jgi:hypothetical protein